MWWHLVDRHLLVMSSADAMYDIEGGGSDRVQQGYRIEPLNRLAFPKGKIPRCEISGQAASVACITPHITLYYATEEQAEQAWHGKAIDLGALRIMVIREFIVFTSSRVACRLTAAMVVASALSTPHEHRDPSSALPTRDSSAAKSCMRRMCTECVMAHFRV